MRTLAAALVLATGCTAIFGLDAPTRGDARTPDRDAPDDVVDAPDDAPIDAGSDAMTDALTCAPEFVAITGQSSRYYFGGNNQSWADAETECEQRGAHLVVLGNETERVAVHTFNGTTLWIGLSDQVTPDTYLWVTSEDTAGYPPATGSPWSMDPKGGTGDCVTMGGASGLWTPLDCGNSRNFICECDAYDANPANF